MTTDTYTPPEHGWTCFHCGETFMHENTARVHFGAYPDAEPGCMLRMQSGERPLLRKIRALEREVERLNHIIDTENTEALQSMRTMSSDHRQALIRGEEKGYAKGFADAINGEPESDQNLTIK